MRKTSGEHLKKSGKIRYSALLGQNPLMWLALILPFTGALLARNIKARSLLSCV